MSAAACKVIINNGFAAWVEGLTTVLNMKESRDKLGREKVDELLNALSDVEANAFNPLTTATGTASHSVRDVAYTLVSAGILDDRIWLSR